MNGTQVTPGGGGARADIPTAPPPQYARSTQPNRPRSVISSPRCPWRAAIAGSSPRSGPPTACSTCCPAGPANVDAIVAVADGVIVGHAMAADLPERICPDASRITDVGVVVADAWQRRGVGAALMRALIARAQARGVTALAMDVLPGNRRVLAMILGHWPDAAVGHSPDGLDIHIALPSARPRETAQPPERRQAGPAAGPGGRIASGSMTTVRPGHVTTAAVPPRDLAAALRGAGLTEVDDSARRRAEYSSDASNYRVVPSVVVVPPARRRGRPPRWTSPGELGVPLTSRGGGTSIAGNARRIRRRARLLAAPEPGPVASTPRRGPRSSSPARPGRHHRGRGPARAALRPGPLHALAGHASAARSATTPAARGR